MSSTKSIENYKDFEPQLEIIRLINSWDNADVSLSKENIFSTIGKITKQKKEIHIEINVINFPHFGDFHRMNKEKNTRLIIKILLIH